LIVEIPNDFSSDVSLESKQALNKFEEEELEEVVTVMG